jgi:hypothetical protein
VSIAPSKPIAPVVITIDFVIVVVSSNPPDYVMPWHRLQGYGYVSYNPLQRTLDAQRVESVTPNAK